jgi:cob(I)alamin adenosyltransferase
MTIYTKRGDKGETNLLDRLSSQKKKISKASLRISAIGAVDEVNSFLGIIATNTDPELRKILREIQKELFLIGSILAGAKLRFYSTKIKRLEKQIDEMDKILPPLKNFIFPGGTEVGAQLHFSRSLARRTERVVARLSKKEKVHPQIIKYLNRLSDLLFMLARKVNSDAKIKEEIWKSG